MVTEGLASIWSRILAFLLDWLILAIPMFIFYSIIPVIGPCILGFLYFPVFHASPLRATLGKKALGIQVVGTNGQTLTLRMAALRFLVASASVGLLFVGHFVALFTEKRQTLHDLVADSIVVVGASEVSPWDVWVETLQSSFSGIGEKSSTSQKLDTLERLHELRKKGAISEEEFQRLKDKLEL